MRTLFLAWRDPHSRAWYPIGRLQQNEGGYEFCYVKGVLAAMEKSGFCPFPSFPDIHETYSSRELFPLFSNRLMPHSRPEYAAFTEWLSLAKNEDDPMALLARSGGERATDTMELFPCPERDSNGYYHIHFFAHGLRHMPVESQRRAEQLESGERLRMMHDFQNAYDPKALLLRTDERKPGDMYNVGFCPRYLVEDIFELLKQNASDLAGSVDINVERVNPTAPMQFRLLCGMTVRWADDFRPFATEAYQPVR